MRVLGCKIKTFEAENLRIIDRQ